LAHNLNIRVVAEGVETKEQVDFLTENGCDILQSYYFSKPLTNKQLEDNWLKN
ncbi:MAG: EAL domain-containing protein, partial [Proteobacteria bacterium]|nr:EAL domain-containing protein [Pseudomonadota bacterium]